MIQRTFQPQTSRIRFVAALLLGMVCLLGNSPAIAQFADQPAGANTKDPSDLQRTAFAPGVLRVIPPAPRAKETFDGPLTLKTFLESNPQIRFGGDTHPENQPHYDPTSRTLAAMAEQVILRREVFCFEFAFKPLRQILIDVPQPSGKMKRKLIWYLVYRVRYVGSDLRPKTVDVGGAPVYGKIQEIHYPSRRVFPSIVLSNRATGKQYLDRLIPSVLETIQVREKITAPLYNSVGISRVPVPYSQPNEEGGVWGVATWEDVDPELDFVSLEAYGLTNALEVIGEGPDAVYRRKALEMHFFRPGDAVNPTEDLIRFGVPAFSNEKEQKYILEQYGLDERLDYRWVFR